MIFRANAGALTQKTWDRVISLLTTVQGGGFVRQIYLPLISSGATGRHCSSGR